MLGTLAGRRDVQDQEPRESMRSQIRRVRYVAMAALLAGAMASLGCVTQTERDEYEFVRSVRVAPSEISLADEPSAPIVMQTDFRTPRWADASRLGTVETELGTR